MKITNSFLSAFASAKPSPPAEPAEPAEPVVGTLAVAGAKFGVIGLKTWRMHRQRN
jgi:hypothetical protein